MIRATRFTGSLVVALMAVSFAAQAEPLSAATVAAVSAAIEKNWNFPADIPNLASYTLMMRLYMTREGAVTKIEVLDDNGDPGFRALAESARRAILITQNEDGGLPIPQSEYNPTIVVRWPMKVICEQRGGC